MKIIFLILGVWIIYILYFLLAEFIFSTEDFHYAGFVTFCELFSWLFLTFLELVCKYFYRTKYLRNSSGFSSHFPPSMPSIPSDEIEVIEHKDFIFPAFDKMFALLGVYTVFGTAFSLYALTLLNFPTWVLFKSCRLIAVAIGSCCMFNTHYDYMDYLGIILMSLGLVIFSLGDKDLNIRFHPLGVIFVLLSLIMNSLQSNFQQKAIKTLNVTIEQCIFYSSLCGEVILLPWLLASGEFIGAWSFLQDHSSQMKSLLITM